MAIGAIGIGLIAVSTGVNAYSAYEQSEYADEAHEIQSNEIRNAQTQLRIQEAQSDITRMKKLQSTIATQEVMFGARNIAPQSGSVRAIFNQDINNFDEDESASKLNYAAKQSNLAYQQQGADLEESARDSSAWLGAATGILGSVMGASKIPSGSLMDASSGSGSASWADAGETSMDINA